jgi:DNA primase
LIPESFIQDLLVRVDIVDVVGRYVQLRKGGANLLGLCPFHNEKSPSFTVSPTKQFYHCFGCGAHGSAITFLIEHTGASFPEAVRTLAGTVGMAVPEENRSPRQQAAAARRKEEISRHGQVLEAARLHYAKLLRGAPNAIRYLKERGLTGEIAAQFGLGWSGTDRQELARVFPQYSDPILVEAGLVIESEDGRRYDRFRERVMFPIRNARGNVIGFGGRIIGKGEPKYLNSPETPLFSKGQELYGLWEARQAIRTEGQVVVVEGYMDVIGLAQSGLGNAVATLGTATTPDHVKKLLRASDKVVFSFDGDKAGRRAAWRALQACLPVLRDDVNLRFLFLPPEHDPDSYVREFGPEAFRASLSEAPALSRFLLDELASRHNLEEAEGRAACVHEAKPLLSAIPPIALRIQIERELARLVLLTPEELAGMLAHAPDRPAGPPGARSDETGGHGGAREAGGSPVAAYDPDGRGGDRHGEPYDSGPYGSEAGGPPGSPPYDVYDSGHGNDYGGHAGEPHGDWRPDPGHPPRGQAGGQWRNGRPGRQDSRPRDLAARRDAARRRPVPTLARRLLRLLLAHPELVDTMGDQQLEVLDHGPHLGMVRDLIVLAQTSGARHLGALTEAVDPDSDLALVLRSMGADIVGLDELPNPQAEWDDALHRIESDAVRAEMQELAQAGLQDDGDRQRYQELSERLAVLRRAEKP